MTRRVTAEYDKMPLWWKELHAWKSNSFRSTRVTLARRVSPSLSLLREHLVPRGIEGLRGMQHDSTCS